MPDKITISRIEFENPRKKTYSLYQDDTFLIEITEDTLVHYSILKGALFSKEEFNIIISFDQVNRCVQQAYSYLQRRPHLKQELFRKLQEKEFNTHIILQAIDRLKEKKYINDAEYIDIYIKDSIRQRKSGPLLLKKKLTDKGAKIHEIELGLQALFNEGLQIGIASEILIKKNKTLKELSPLKRKQKLIQFGIGRGFSWTIIEIALKK